MFGFVQALDHALTVLCWQALLLYRKNPFCIGSFGTFFGWAARAMLFTSVFRHDAYMFLIEDDD